MPLASSHLTSIIFSPCLYSLARLDRNSPFTLKTKQVIPNPPQSPPFQLQSFIPCAVCPLPSALSPPKKGVVNPDLVSDAAIVVWLQVLGFADFLAEEEIGRG